MKSSKYEEYFLKYKNLVIRMVMKKTGDYQVAQEICQQVFISLYMNRNTVPDDLVKAWVMRCTQNAIVDYIRKTKTQKYFMETTGPSTIELGNILADEKLHSVEDMMDNRALTGKILKEVRAVNEQWYEVLMMLCVDGLSYAEAAEKLGISIPVLRSRVYRARIFVREQFGDEYEG